MALINTSPLDLAASPGDPDHPGMFHTTGLIYFWVINDGTDRPRLVRMADRFRARGVAAIVLHPRSGLLVPYGSEGWFELIRWLTDLCEERGIQVWLYDEDPFPSGSAGGQVVAQHPEFHAREIVRYVYDPATQSRTGDGPAMFRFPLEQLLWCGVVDPATGLGEDLSRQVGVVRETWTVLEQWDSRHYYPQTPRYHCPRAWTHRPTYMIPAPEDLAGRQLVAFTARPVKTDHWDYLADTLNPHATRAFLRVTHERYAQVLGDRLGRSVPAIFTDEAKPFGQTPFTPGLFESFENTFGYALAPRLSHLFSCNQDPGQMRTRIDFRQWIAQRFEEAWLTPVSRWCRDHRLHMVGHLSPEDDPVEQAASLGNLMPMHQRLDLPGIDLIIPAVGDDEHPILNIGVIAARSVCDQRQRPGVLSESLACSGVEPDHRIARRVLAWQTMMGMTSPVVHAAYESMEGYRAIDAPPDWGPAIDDWPMLCQLGVDLEPMQQVVRQARQVAPVAVVWPIRSYQAMGVRDTQEPVRLRQELMDLMTLLLDAHVGFHFVDEADLADAEIAPGSITIGAARYTHVVVAPALILHQATREQLETAAAAGVNVRSLGQPPTFLDTGDAAAPLRPGWRLDPLSREAAADLPRLIEIDKAPRNLRCTAWRRGSNVTTLLTNLNLTPARAALPSQTLVIEPSDVWMQTDGSRWSRCFEGLQGDHERHADQSA